MQFNPLEYPICFDVPHRLRWPYWQPHIPFAMFLVAAVRPKLIVELGTMYGDSYCAFCQAVKTLGLPARCYAVDTWQGDSHAGFYGPDVLADLRAHHDPLYAGFSTLLQQTFDEAAPEFADGSIDLLHVDGHHTYEAARHDFDTWLPKMSSQGVVLLHDISDQYGAADYGVWRVWNELTAQYPTFAFRHAAGLGVVAVGVEIPAALRPLFDADPTEAMAIQRYFHALGERLITNNLHRHRGRMFVELERWDDAALHLRWALQAEPEATDIPPTLAKCLIAAGKPAEAAEVLAAAVAANPEQTELRLQLADLLLRAGQPQAALDVLAPALDREPRQAVVYQKLGSVLRALGRYQEAADALVTALQLRNSDNPGER